MTQHTPLKTETGAKILRNWQRGLIPHYAVKSALNDFDEVKDADIISDIRTIISEYIGE